MEMIIKVAMWSATRPKFIQSWPVNLLIPCQTPFSANRANNSIYCYPILFAEGQANYKYTVIR